MNSNKQPCLFVDRDGVVNEEVGYITDVDQLKIYDFAEEAITLAKIKGFKVIVITNQSAVARGMLSEDKLIGINRVLIDKLNVDAVYFCPHLHSGHEEELSHYIRPCDCRKPLPGLILKSAVEHNIDLEQSYMVGDRASDILCGKSAGVKTVLVRTGYGSKPLETQVKPDFCYENLLEFVASIKN